MQRRKFILNSLMVATAALATTPLSSLAQSSNQPLSLVVGFGAGGSADGLSRMVADQLSQRLGRTIVVENRAGALGRIAVDAVATARPGREMLLVAPFSSPVFSTLTVPSWERDIHNDLLPVASLTDFPLAIAVNSDTGVNTLPELLEWYKSDPNNQVFGSSSTGGHNHLLGLAMGKTADLPLQVVAYRGNAPMITDMLGGHLPVGLGVIGDFLQHHESGRMKILAVLTADRTPLMPSIPTAKEQGLDVTSGEAWYAMWATPTMPQEDVARIQEELSQILEQESFKDQVAERYLMTTRYLDGKDMDKRLRESTAYWKGVIEETGFTPEQ